MGLFPDENINWYQKLTCDDPKPSLSFCLPIVATVAKGRGKSIISFDGCHAPPALWVCSTSSFVDLLPKAPQGKSKSSARLKKNLKKYFIYIYIPKNPPLKKLLKIGRGKGLPCPTTVVMVTDWLRPPCFKMVVGLDLDTNRHGIPIPQGWITPTTKTPSGGHRTHQEALTIFVVICELQSTSWLLTGTPHSRKNSSASRKDTLLHLILSLTLRLVPNGYYIRDTSSIIKILVFLHFTYTPLLPKTPPKKYHITRFM